MTRHQLKLLSVIIPARNEEGCIASTINELHLTLTKNLIPYEIVVVDDGSTDSTWKILSTLSTEVANLQPIQNVSKHGFGSAIIKGIEASRGDAIAIMMADNSDSPKDLVTYWRELNKGYDCIFGSRFIRGSEVYDYPLPKLLINRMANKFIKILFNIPLNDTTNAFKAYRRSAIDGCLPLISQHFNLTVELPLKAIIRGYSWKVVAIEWKNRKTGESKLKIKEMGSRYLFIVMYCLLEKLLSRGDYKK